MWPTPQETADLVIFTGEILYGKLHFLYSVYLLAVRTNVMTKCNDLMIKNVPYLESENDDYV